MSSIDDKDEVIEHLKLNILLLQKELEYIKQSKSTTMIDAETQYEPLTIADEFRLYKDNNERSDLSIYDMIKETSEAYLSSSGYSYDEKTGLYYHSKSGYYYDPNNMLFYDPKNGFYYSYDADTNEYKYHSQDNIPELVKLNSELLWTQGYQHRPLPQQTVALGESGLNVDIVPAPCMRIIDEATGELAIITCCGGSLGSGTEMNHSMLFSSGDHGDAFKIDLRVTFDASDGRYRICQQVQENSDGTICLLNKAPITKIPLTIDHHSKLVINKRSYLVHIHDDYKTCNWCEPGQVKEKLSAISEKRETNSESVNLKIHHRRFVDQLKMKYGLKSGFKSTGFWRKRNPSSQSNYIDRSLIRRTKEKQENKAGAAKLHNVGVRMMLKMGWKLNEPIGLSGTGITEPIDVYQRLDARAGIGCEHAVNVHVESDPKTIQQLKKRQALISRYKSLFDK